MICSAKTNLGTISQSGILIFVFFMLMLLLFSYSE